jgi:hypothetical protein
MVVKSPVDRLSELARLVDGERLLATLAVQVERIGPRPTGSRGAHRLRRWLRRALAGHGLDVREDSFPVVTLRRAAATLDVAGEPLPCTPFVGLPPAFPYLVPGRLRRAEGRLVVAAGLAELERQGDLKDAVVALDEPVDDAGVLTAAAAVALRGGLGLVVSSARRRGAARDLPFFNLHLHGLQGLPLSAAVPVLDVPPPGRERLIAGRRAELTWDVEYQVSRAWNVHARVGREAGGPRVLVAAHYDSPYTSPDCPAANDNGVGVSIALELARCCAQLAGRRQATPEVEFCFYDGEEYDAVGCWPIPLDLERMPGDSLDDAVAAHAALVRYRLYLIGGDAGAAQDIRLHTPLAALRRPRYREGPCDVIEIDTMGAGPNLLLAGDPAAELEFAPAFRALTRELFPAARLRTAAHVSNVATAMRACGVEGASLVLQREGERPPMHSADDDLTSIDPRALEAMTVLHLALLLGREPAP